MYRVFFIVSPDHRGGGYVVDSYSSGKEVAVIDLDTGVKLFIKKPSTLDGLEELFEEYEPVILFCKSINENYRLSIEESGVRVISGLDGYLDKVLDEIRGE